MGARALDIFVELPRWCAKLFHVVEPDVAFFGQKDAAQVAIIRRMVRDLNFPVEIVACPIVREADGLAMSSRNAYLDPQQRRQALVLHRSLLRARKLWEGGDRARQNWWLPVARNWPENSQCGSIILKSSTPTPWIQSKLSGTARW